MSLRGGVQLLSIALVGSFAASAGADPTLIDPSLGVLELVTPDAAEQAKLERIDGLAFDSAGNLFGALEIADSSGGIVSIDIDSGLVTVLTTGIPRADQIALHTIGDFFVHLLRCGITGRGCN